MRGGWVGLVLIKREHNKSMVCGLGCLQVVVVVVVAHYAARL